MAKVRDAVVRIRGQETVSDASKKARNSLGQLDKTGQTMTQKGARNWTALASKAGIYGAAITGVVMGVKNLVSAYAEQEAAERGLAAAARNNPYLDASAVDRLKDFTSELQGVSVMGDEVALGFAKIAAASGRTESEIEELLQATVDTAAALDVSLDTAFQQLNKTFGGTAGELGELVPEIKNLSAEQLEAGEGVDLLREKFRGMGEEMRDTTKGQMMSFSNAWGDLKEQLGGFLDLVIAPIVEGLTMLISELNDGLSVIREFINVMATDFKMTMEEIDELFAPLVERIENWGEGFKRAVDSIHEFLKLRGEEQRVEIGTASADEERRVLERELDRMTEEVQRRQQELQRVEETAAREIVSQGISEGTALFREELQREVAPYEESLERAIREQSTTAQRLAQIEQAARSEGAAAAEGEELTEDQRIIQDTVAEISKQFRLLEEQAAIPGREMDLFAEKQKVLNSAIDDLIEQNFTVSGGGIQYIIDQFGEYLEEATVAAGKFGADLDKAGTRYLTGSGERARGRFGADLGGGGPETLVSGSIATAAGGSEGTGILDTFLGFLGDASGEFGEMIAATSDFQAILNPITTILKSAFEVVAPAFKSAVEPLLNILTTLGQVLGTILLPYYEILGMLTKELGKAFLWLYNSVLRPVGNFIISTFETVANFFIKIVRGIINAINRIPGVSISKPKKVSFTRLDRLEELGEGDLETDTTGGGESSPYGGNTTVRQPPDIYIYQHFHGPVVGEGAMEQVGEFMVQAIEAYAGSGGEVTFQEA